MDAKGKPQTLVCHDNESNYKINTAPINFVNTRDTGVVTSVQLTSGSVKKEGREGGEGGRGGGNDGGDEGGEEGMMEG